MAWLTDEELKNIGFKSFGKDVKISDKAIIYKPERIQLGDRVQVDDFCVLSNHITIHNNVHIALYSCLISSDDSHIEMEDFSGLAYRCTVLASSDDYNGDFLNNPTVPREYHQFSQIPVKICKHVVIGAGSLVLPGVTLAEGTSVAAMSLVTKSTEPWTVYLGIPAKPMKPRRKNMLELEREYTRTLEGN